MLLEPQRMNTFEPFSITKPFEKVKDKIVDTGKNVGDKVADTGKGAVDKVADVGKNVGGKVADVGKKVGGTVVSIGKGIGKVLGPAFKKIFEFLMMILKNWKLALCIAVSCCLCYLAAPFIMPIFSFFK
jgi:hypothetical protein